MKGTIYLKMYIRGAIHVHWFACVKDAPVYGKVPNSELAEFYDKIISCSSDVPELHKEYIQYQIHRHSKSCRMGKARSCRFSFPKPPMDKTCVLEPLTCEEQEDNERGKELWIQVKRLLNSYGLGTETTDTFEVMLEQLNMSYHDYILAVHSTIVRPQFYSKHHPCEILINNYMRNCLLIWRANHDIQPCLSPHAMIEYILNYVTKGQKGMSAQMEKACKDANKGDMDFKQSVQHIGNVFLNAVETGEEAIFPLLQAAMTFMRRESVFINTSPPNQRMFLVKSKKQLEQLDPDSTDIAVDNLIHHYQNRQHQMEDYCLTDFASKVNICQQTKAASGPSSKSSTVLCFSQNTVYQRRKKDRIICYVNCSKKKDPGNYYCERLMLFLPWRNELTDLKANCDSYKEKYMMHKDDIEKICIHYEKFNEDLKKHLRMLQVKNMKKIYLVVRK